MRTTLTLDSDVAARIERERRKRDVPEDIVNQALRAGLDNLDVQARRQQDLEPRAFRWDRVRRQPR